MTLRTLLLNFLLCFCAAPLGLAELTEVASNEELKKLASTYLAHPTRIAHADKPLAQNGSPNIELQSPSAKGNYPSQEAACPAQGSSTNGYTINFENIRVIELIRFISQISNTNFIFDSKELDFRITIVSEDPTSVENLMAALVQVLQMHGMSVVEQGNNVLIYRSQAGPQSLSKISTIVTDDNIVEACGASIVTRVFRLYNIAPERVVGIVRPLVSKDAIVDVSAETRHLILTDMTANVDKIADLLTALDTPNAALDVAEYAVQSAFPNVLVAFAKEILAPLAQDNPVQLIAQASSHKIFIVSTPYLINKAMQILRSLDSADITDVSDLPPSAMPNNIFHVYKLKYQDGQSIASAIRDIGTNLQYLSVSNPDLINTIYSMEWIEVNNSLVITGTQEAVEKVVQLIEDLDVAPKQVYLEVLVIDTTLSNSLDFGVQWVALGNEQSKLAYASGLFDTTNFPSLGAGVSPNLLVGAKNALRNPPPDAARATQEDVPLPPGFGFGIVGNIIRHHGMSFLTLGALINALEAEAETTVVLNPKIIVEDFQTANLFVGQNIPYQTTNTIIRDTGSVTQNIQYEDIGVQLRIIPTISPDNVVTLQIDQSISEVITTNGITDGLATTLTPTTTKILSSTRLHVPDGTFLVMSGLVRDQKSCTKQGIPCLGTLPLIGPAFSTTVESRVKRNLIMFVRPHVITSI